MIGNGRISEVRMKVNVKKLDETIAKLQELRRLATDPSLATFVSITGRATSTNAPQVATEAAAHANGNGTGTLKGSVLEVSRQFSGKFNIKNVLVALHTKGFLDVQEKSVANSLRSLAKDGELRVVEVGSGRRPTDYANVG
jgi:UDP-N-acetylmuramyl tripeptide synthase